MGFMDKMKETAAKAGDAAKGAAKAGQDKIEEQKLKKKMADLYYTSQGYIPDGLLFRVSSIDRNTTVAFDRQAEFIKAILGAMNPAVRTRLAGISAKDSS